MQELEWKEHLDKVFQVIPEGVIVINRDSRKTIVSSKAEKILGLKKSEILKHIYSGLTQSRIASDEGGVLQESFLSVRLLRPEDRCIKKPTISNALTDPR